jgi:hypothetical protein
VRNEVSAVRLGTARADHVQMLIETSDAGPPPFRDTAYIILTVRRPELKVQVFQLIIHSNRDGYLPPRIA